MLTPPRPDSSASSTPARRIRSLVSGVLSSAAGASGGGGVAIRTVYAYSARHGKRTAYVHERPRPVDRPTTDDAGRRPRSLRPARRARRSDDRRAWARAG